MREIEAITPPPHPAIVVLGSLVGNALLWIALGFGSIQPVRFTAPPELVFDRVTVENHEVREKPVLKPIIPKPPKIEPKRPEPKQPRVVQPPEGAHNKIIAAAPSKSPTPSNAFVVPSGGNAGLGKPIEAQNPGNATVNPPKPPVTPPVTPPPVTPPPITTPPVTTPPVKKEEPPVTTPPVKKEEPPPPVKPKGETREAKPDHQESVELPESLKSQSFKSFVRVRVEIAADGKFTVTLRTSSGNSQVDKLVLDTLNKWSWKPALKDGEAVESVQQFRFNFSIE